MKGKTISTTQNMLQPFIPFVPFQLEGKPEQRSSEFFRFLNLRRSIRDFSTRPVSLEVMENLVLTAGTSPSGANKQPWTFCIVGDLEIKMKIRKAAEKEEFESYNGRMTKEWLEDLEALGTDWRKPFLENAPWLVVIFKRVYEKQGAIHRKNYYVNESIGIATGIFLAAVHNAGLVALTHTPSPMDFLGKILNRPENERPFLLIPVGYPEENAMIPNIHRKALNEIMQVY